MIKAKNVCFVSQEGFSYEIYLVQNIQMECGEPFYKKVACLHVIFISQHFDWVLCVIQNMIG